MSAYSKGTQERASSRRDWGVGGVAGVDVALGVGMGVAVEVEIVGVAVGGEMDTAVEVEIVGVAVGGEMDTAVEVEIVGVAVGEGMDATVEVGWEQAIATGRTKAMAITIKIARIGAFRTMLRSMRSHITENLSRTRLHLFSSAYGAFLRQKIPHYGSVML